LPPCICKRASGGIGDGGEGKSSTRAGGGGIVDGREDRPEDGCEVNYISGLGNVTLGWEECCNLGSQNKRAGEGRLGLVNTKRG